MTKPAGSISVYEEEGQFFFTLDQGETLEGPYETEEAATKAATDHLTQIFTDLAKQALFGASK